MKFYMEADHTG